MSSLLVVGAFCFWPCSFTVNVFVFDALRHWWTDTGTSRWERPPRTWKMPSRARKRWSGERTDRSTCSRSNGYAVYYLFIVLQCSVYKSLHGMAPKYLAELCRPISDVQGRRHLRSAARGLLLTPHYYLSMYGRRAFSYAGPSPGILLQNICRHLIWHLSHL